ncbi:MBL fold metallo-hydrolase [Sediminibacterium ginsengisoli]|uniref:Glyoxylase, beta-lactamase superfamily II n=1 Tax=Sediminibacterium ginsengisoli TaxID=413434 RepID=A0A1T4NJK9_9BACT|nr:MBL fold metallo-hydrolase [Sediminibacterium ginsengisoli]SJZ79217.1 Glyoxylase, beta-lactamase superfamily II [Sediminibacterium ginsengisoli]
MLSIKSFEFSPIQENTYLLYDDQGKAIIIDPGCYFGVEHETLKNFITRNGLSPVQLLNTHCHLDHVFGNKWVHEQYGLELYLHPEEEQVLAYAPTAGIRWSLPFDNYEGPLHFLEAGDTVTLGNSTLKVLFTPGHSPGSICFYSEEQGFVIGGDVLFYESIGRTDLPLGDHETLLRSIREQLFTLPDNTVVYPGHGRSTTIGYEKRNNPFLLGT